MPKFKEKTKVIEVKPVDADDNAHIITYDESNVSASPDTTGIKSYQVSSLGNTMKDNASGADSGAEFSKIEEYKIKHMQTLMNLSQNYEEWKRQTVAEVTKTTEGTSNVDGTDVGGDTSNGENEKKKKKKKKGKRKKKKKKDKAESVETTEATPNEASDQKSNDDPKIEVVEAGPNDAQEKKKRKLPCLFGFISTWLAKRKEKRRVNKRRAIEARAARTPVDALVEYEHKLAKGGVAFTLEVDNRPIIKPVLPPIKPRPGPIVHGTEEKLRLAELKRLEELEKKKQSAKDNERKIAEVHEKKAESEFHFKQKASLTIRYKQYDAERKRARVLEDRRCSTPLLRAPSTLPPLRIKPANQTGSRASDARDADSDDGVFDF